MRGEGGYVIGQGAVLPDGKRWVPVSGKPPLAHAFKNGIIPELPQWLEGIIRPNRDGVDQNARMAFSKTDVSRGQAYAAAALQGAAGELSTTSNGKRNETLNAVAYRMGKLIARDWIDEKTVTDALLGACDATSICVSMVIGEL